jgi:pantothenate kinase
VRASEPLGDPPAVASFDALVRRARSVGAPGRGLLGIAGAPGAGKSTFAARLAGAIPAAVVIPMDGFHRTTAELQRLGRVERRGAPDTFDAGAFVALLAQLRTDLDVRAPGFDRTAEEPVADAVGVPGDARLVIVEGNYLLLDEPPWHQVRDSLDEIWFLEIPEPVRAQRLQQRFVSYGMAPAAAAARVRHGSDARNAVLVAVTRCRADLIIRAES